MTILDLATTQAGLSDEQAAGIAGLVTHLAAIELDLLDGTDAARELAHAAAWITEPPDLAAAHTAAVAHRLDWAILTLDPVRWDQIEASSASVHDYSIRMWGVPRAMRSAASASASRMRCWSIAGFVVGAYALGREADDPNGSVDEIFGMIEAARDVASPARRARGAVPPDKTGAGRAVTSR